MIRVRSSHPGGPGRLARVVAAPPSALLALLLLAGTLSACRADRPRPLTIYCASSAVAVLEEIAEQFDATREPGTPPVAVHGASSSTLARQISAGAPADLFVSVHPDWITALAEEGKVAIDTARVMAHNSLVIAARVDGPDRVPSVPDRCATGDPDHVPLGVFAAQALAAQGRWDTWRARLLPAADARAAVEYLRRGEATVAVLYRTDVVAAADLKILEEIPGTLHDPIELVVVEVTGARPGTEALHAFLGDVRARARLGAAGFRAGLAPRAGER